MQDQKFRSFSMAMVFLPRFNIVIICLYKGIAIFHSLQPTPSLTLPLIKVSLRKKVYSHVPSLIL